MHQGLLVCETPCAIQKYWICQISCGAGSIAAKSIQFKLTGRTGVPVFAESFLAIFPLIKICVLTFQENISKLRVRADTLRSIKIIDHLSNDVLDALACIIRNKSAAGDVNLCSGIIYRPLIMHQPTAALGELFFYGRCLMLHVRNEVRFSIPSLSRVKPSTTGCSVGAMQIFDK